jgi:hypothetical protein
LALFHKKDSELLLAIQKELERFTVLLVEALRAGVTPAQEKLIAIVFGHILTIYPFLEPQTKILKIPQKNAKQYELVDYNIERLELTPPWLGSPLTAFGLTPNEVSGPSLLLFMGTPQFTASGALLSLWSDVAPGCSVGEFVFRLFAKKKIASWLNKVEGDVKVYGKSLGGSLGILTACTFPEKIAELHAYSPPAPFGRVLQSYDLQQKEKKKSPQICIYWQANDFIPLFGSGFHKDWTILYLVPEKKQNWFLAHIRSVPALNYLKVYYADPAIKNRKILRKALILLSQFLMVPIFLFVTLVLALKTAIRMSTKLCLRRFRNWVE